MGDGRFRVIQGGPAKDGKAKPKRYRAPKPGEIEPLVCKCGSAASIEITLGRMIKKAKPQGGTKQLRCYDCGAVLL